MQTLNIEQINGVSGGSDGQECATSILMWGAAGAGIGASLGGWIGAGIGALVGGAIGARVTPECHPEKKAN
jgi:hypothetical protein